MSGVPPHLSQALLDGIRWPAVAVDPAGTIVAHNAEWTRLHAERVGASYFDAVASAELVGQLKALLTGEQLSVEAAATTALGPYRVSANRFGAGLVLFHALDAGASTSVVNSAFEFDAAARYVLSPEGRMLALNRVARESVQRLRGRVTVAGDSLWDLISPESRGVATEGLRRAALGEAWFDQREVTFPTGNRFFESRFEPVHDARRAVVAVQLTVVDVTQRRSDEQARVTNESLEVLQRLAHQVPTLLAYWDRDLRCRFANEAYRGFFGRPLNEVVQLRLPELLGPLLYEQNRPHVEQALSGVAQNFEREVASADGRPPRFVHVSYTPDVHGGEVPGFFAMVTDVTWRRELELELRQAQKMEAVGQLSSGIAHDFNNLLTVVLASAENVLTTLTPGNPVIEDLEAIVQAGRRAAALTKQLLAFGRRALVSPQVVELGPLLSRMGTMLRRTVREDIRIELSPGPAGRVRIDPSQFEQVVVNLVLNGQDAMPTGGALHLETGWRELDEGDGVLAAGEYAVLTVKDTGKGMSAETMTRVFEPFFTTKPLGTAQGLGLSTVYSIARQAGGVVRAQSEVGAGSTFTVWLPLLEAPQVRAGPDAAEVVAASGEETVLVVEDEVMVSMMATRLLRSLGYRVLTAHTGEEALRVMRETTGSIDLLLTDVVMPGLNGPELARRMLAERPRMRVLYSSGYTDDIALRNGVRMGTTHFLPKPYTSDALRAKVREVLDLPPPSAPAPR